MLRRRRPIWPSSLPLPPSPVLTTCDSCGKTAYCVAVSPLSSFAPSAAMPNRLKSDTHHHNMSRTSRKSRRCGDCRKWTLASLAAREPPRSPPTPTHHLFKEPDTSTAAACQACWTAAWPIGQLPVNKIPALYQLCPAVPRPPTPLHSPIVAALCVSRSRQ